MAMLDNQMVFVKCGLSSPVWIFSMDGTSFYDSHWGLASRVWFMDFHSSDGGKESWNHLIKILFQLRLWSSSKLNKMEGIYSDPDHDRNWFAPKWSTQNRIAIFFSSEHVFLKPWYLFAAVPKMFNTHPKYHDISCRVGDINIRKPLTILTVSYGKLFEKTWNKWISIPEMSEIPIKNPINKFFHPIFHTIPLFGIPQKVWWKNRSYQDPHQWLTLEITYDCMYASGRLFFF